MKKTVSILLALFVSLSSASALAESCPEDVPEDRWSSESVADALNRGMLSLEDGQFFPKRAATWAEASAAVRILTGEDVPEHTEGIITRGELAALLYHIVKSAGEGFSGLWAFPLRYSDASDIPEEQHEALCWMTMKNIFNGFSDGRIAAAEQLTREQLAAVLFRFRKALPELTAATYTLHDIHEVNGRQGVAAEGGFYWVSGSASLTKYDKNWNVVAENTAPFSRGYEREVNHIGDIDVCKNEVYCGVELFLDGEAKNIQIAVYDGDTLELRRAFPFDPESGQTEVSGIAVDPENNSVWMCSWAESAAGGDCLYRYDLTTGAYLGKVRMEPAPRLIQGVACHNGFLYVTADDGDADKNEADTIWRGKFDPHSDVCRMTVERKLTDVTRQGEIEGLTFDDETGELMVLYNRGARIVLGMPVGFYEGYDHEIHEVFRYGIS